MHACSCSQAPFELPASCARQLQSILEAQMAEHQAVSRAASAGGGAASGGGSVATGLTAGCLIDVLWGLDVAGHRPTEAHLNLLVILGTVSPRLHKWCCGGLGSS